MFGHYRAVAVKDIRLQDIPLITHPSAAAQELAYTADGSRIINDWDLPQDYGEFVSQYHARYGEYNLQSFRYTWHDVESGYVILLKKSTICMGFSSVLTPSGDLCTDLPLGLQVHLRDLLSRQQRDSGSHASPHVEYHAVPEQQPVQRAQSVKKREKREITLTLGVFFDGTGNNAVNTVNMLKGCLAENVICQSARP